MSKIDSFTEAYITCALWSSTDNADVPLDRKYTMDDIAEESLAAMVADCDQFREYTLFDGMTVDQLIADDSQGGHDFWLTRNRHGAGFWDSPDSYGGKRYADNLTKIAHTMGEVDLYVGDDGKVYCG